MGASTCFCPKHESEPLLSGPTGEEKPLLLPGLCPTSSLCHPPRTMALSLGPLTAGPSRSPPDTPVEGQQLLSSEKHAQG